VSPKFIELTAEYDNIDFDTSKEASSFFGNLKNRMLDAVKLISRKEPAAAFAWIKDKIDENIQLISTAGLCLVFVCPRDF
jgi:hypothetical protein